MIEKLRGFSPIKKITYFILLSIIWLLIASQLKIGIQANWILSSTIIAIIANLFYPMNKKK